MILKRCNKLCHFSRVNLPFVRMSASWFWDSTYLIRTFGSGLILSNNQSRAIQWARDTCLIVGLLPLMGIFITASLSSKMFNCDSFSERCTFEGTRSMCDRSTFWSDTCLILAVLWVLAPVSRLHARVLVGILGVVHHKSSASKPSIRKPASNDIISDSVELWDNDVRFLHIQLIGTIIRASRLSHAWVHFVTDRANLLTDHRMSKVRFFLSDLVIVQTGMRNFVLLLRLFVCQFEIPFHAFSSMSFHVVGPRSPAEIRDSNIIAVLSNDFLVGFASPLSAS